jgi:phospholipase/carboxylesterase
MSNQIEKTEIGNWVLMQKLPESTDSPRLMLMLHGWTGDENSMWIFAHRIPSSYMLLAPRGPTATQFGGYGWEGEMTSSWPAAGDFQFAIRNLFDLVDGLDYPGLSKEQFDVMGFSQGAALAYTLLLQHPHRIGKLAGLSGFLPRGLENEIEARKLSGKELFIAHGTRDHMVSLDKARNAVEELKSAGAEVIYCEEDVGHKLSSGCFRAMDSYFRLPSKAE